MQPVVVRTALAHPIAAACCAALQHQPTISMSADECPLTLTVVEAGFLGCTPLYDAAPLALHAPQMLDCMYAQQILLLAWPPRPMPVRQSWVESVLAPGGYGSYSVQRHLLRVAARWATCASSSRSRRYSIPTVQLTGVRYRTVQYMSAHSSLVYYLEIP